MVASQDNRFFEFQNSNYTEINIQSNHNVNHFRPHVKILITLIVKSKKILLALLKRYYYIVNIGCVLFRMHFEGVFRGPSWYVLCLGGAHGMHYVGCILRVYLGGTRGMYSNVHVLWYMYITVHTTCNGMYYV